MTRFPFRATAQRAQRSVRPRDQIKSFVFSLPFLLGLAGCVGASSGAPAGAIAQANIAAVYLPLHADIHLGLDTEDGAAVVLAPGIAATNDHNRGMVAPKTILGFGSRSDLRFFRTARSAQPQTAEPAPGQGVSAYGQGGHAELRIAHGTICNIAGTPADSPYFVFVGNAGPGFSGGPVLDDQGRLVGITFAYLEAAKGQRLIFAYGMKRVWAEFERKQPRRYDAGGDAPAPSLQGCPAPLH
jgi:hypothetical protein